MSGTYLDCGCYIDANGLRTLCPTCADGGSGSARDPVRDAAPDLLAALKAMVNRFGVWERENCDCPACLDISRARIAIAKAEARR